MIQRLWRLVPGRRLPDPPTQVRDLRDRVRVVDGLPGDLAALPPETFLRLAGGVPAREPPPLVTADPRVCPWQFVQGHAEYGGAAADIGVYRLADVVYDGRGLARDADGAALTSFETTPLYWANELAAGLGERLHPATTIKAFDRPAIACMTPGLRAYGHWLLEILPRLWLARLALGDEAFEAHAVLVDSTTPDWAYGMMRTAAGVLDSQIVTYDRTRTLWRVENLILPGMLHGDFRFHPWAARFFAALPDSGRTDLPRRIYIARSPETASRPGANRRVTDNVKEIEAHLASLGIHAVHPEHLSWADQIAMFRRARLVVGEFGSGLHNAVFTEGGTRIVCLGFMNYIQSTIAALRNHRLALVAPLYERRDEGGVSHLAFSVEAITLALKAAKRARAPTATAVGDAQPA